MDEEEKANHIMSLWLRTMAKLRGAVKVLEIFGDLNRRLYLYGSDKKQDYLIEHESMKPCPFVMFPYSKPKTVWNLVMMVLMVYTGVYVPYKTAFIDESEDYVNTIELSIDSLFIIDIFINFISAYEDKDRNIEFRLSRIAFVYIRSWFLIDVVSCIPF